jgi:nucleotide-binding universal stress UspA family protein
MKAKPTKSPGEVILKVNRRDEPLLEASSRAPAGYPFRIKNILVPIDFSECARKALQYALPFAKEHEAAITLLYVAPPPSYAVGEYGGVDYMGLVPELKSNAEKDLSRLAADELRGEVPVKTIVSDGAAAAGILDVAEHLPADIIVISTHGRTGLKHVLLGSVAEHVVRNAPCPVLVVREREREFLAN